MKTRLLIKYTCALALASILGSSAYASGVLTPVGSPEQAIQTRSHHVDVVINNGFAKTTFTQVFYNPNAANLEAIYEFPVPKDASLSEMTITSGEDILKGEVVRKADAERIYEEEKQKGNDAGLGTKNNYQNYTFKVSSVRAQGETRMEVVYYQPIDIDTNVGRYVYPLEEGGTDEAAQNFWTMNTAVEEAFDIRVSIRSSASILDIRTPNFGGRAQQDEQGQWSYEFQSQGGSLDKDFVLYYRLDPNLPGRVEVIPYKSSKDEEGTFMMVVTPGIDLKPLSQGADYLFVLDKSGSMSSKINTLAQGVEQALGTLKPHDRFQIIVFDNQAQRISSGWTAATTDNVTQAISRLNEITASGGTNIYHGLELAFETLDNDRATNVILVTDGVTNQGIVDPAKFYALMQQHDVRLFGFLMGNSSNWPLMRVICEASDGFYATVSSRDDVVGKIMQAKSKIAYECLHDAKLDISGVKTYNVNKNFTGKVFRGQQLVLFGRYASAGRATLRLEASFTGGDHDYVTEFDFPEVAEANPEIERLWAMSQIQETQFLESIGKLESKESKDAVADLGVAYQLVTDETSMLALKDEGFARHGITRSNQERVARENSAQTSRMSQPVQSYRVDNNKPMFTSNAPSVGGGGGAFGWEGLLILVGALPMLRFMKKS